VVLPLELDGVRVRQARRLALAALSEVDLDGQGQRSPDELSGGQQQRSRSPASSIVDGETPAEAAGQPAWFPHPSRYRPDGNDGPGIHFAGLASTLWLTAR
jgi:hypothetical protein